MTKLACDSEQNTPSGERGPRPREPAQSDGSSPVVISGEVRSEGAGPSRGDTGSQLTASTGFVPSCTELSGAGPGLVTCAYVITEYLVAAKVFGAHDCKWKAAEVARRVSSVESRPKRRLP